MFRVVALTRSQMASLFGVPQMQATSVWQVCLFDGDGGEEDYVWRTAVFSSEKRAHMRARTQGCMYTVDELVLDEPMYGGWEAVN